ncbi:MAG: hypothetical protein ACR2J8_00965 [Thermomicrobiales bacterium]
MSDSANTTQPISPAMERRARGALVIVGLMVMIVAVLLPVVIFSLSRSLQSVEEHPVYNLVTGNLETNIEAKEGDDVTFANISIVSIDESTRAATLLVSGNRNCGKLCVKLDIEVYSLASEGSLRRGLPPSVALNVPEASGPLTETVTLPVSGNPQRYPFDEYTLVLGMTARATRPDGGVISVPLQQMTQRSVLTVDSSLVRLSMHTPTPLDPAAMTPAGSEAPFLFAQKLVFSRPLYLQIICTLLVMLISASGFFALWTQTLRQLSLGIGGLILGIWGVRSIVIQGNLPEVTVVDSVLAIIILLLLLGVAVRVALAVRSQTGWGEH